MSSIRASIPPTSTIDGLIHTVRFSTLFGNDFRLVHSGMFAGFTYYEGFCATGNAAGRRRRRLYAGAATDRSRFFFLSGGVSSISLLCFFHTVYIARVRKIGVKPRWILAEKP